MKAAISIPDAVFQAAERIAKRKGVSRSELYVQAIAALVREEDEREITAQLDRVYADQDSCLDATLAGLPAKTLKGEDW